MVNAFVLAFSLTCPGNAASRLRSLEGPRENAIVFSALSRA